MTSLQCLAIIFCLGFVILTCAGIILFAEWICDQDMPDRKRERPSIDWDEFEHD